MNHLKVIKNDHEHSQALARLMILMDGDFDDNSVENDELDVLALLIEQYEKEEFPIDIPNPIDAIKFRMDQMGLKNKDLTPYIGSASKVSEVLNHKRKLSLSMIRKLHNGLDIPLDVLINDIHLQQAHDSDVQWSNFPLNQMFKNGYFNAFEGNLYQLKEVVEEELHKFISTVRNGHNLQPVMLRSSAHHRNNDKEINQYALWAWQVKVLAVAQNEKLPCPFVKGSIDKEWLIRLVQLSRLKDGALLAKEVLNNAGIHLIIEPHLEKTYLDGAICTSENGNPIIALTLRHDRLDNFWFTLMHELSHLVLHLEDSDSWFTDNLDATGTDQIETEADELASEVLISKSIWEKEKSLNWTESDVTQFANQLSISPCIVAGRIRYEFSDHALFGRKFRGTVRSLFE